jgi:CRISPR-associated protein Cmr6
MPEFSPRLQAPSRPCENAAQALHFGLARHGGKRTKGETAKSDKAADYAAQHFNAVCDVSAPPLYAKAFGRWEKSLPDAACAKANLPLQHRLFIGISDPHLLETCITLNPVYGVPVIPGSACKGLARAMAEHYQLVDPRWVKRVFGDDDLNASDRTAGMVIFHDAWWVPGSAPGTDKNRPLVREIVTPHHKEFVDTKGNTPATPFDGPVPVAQIAAHGSFLFAVEGLQILAKYALNLLTVGLQLEGIGARTPEYGTIRSVAAAAVATERR